MFNFGFITLRDVTIALHHVQAVQWGSLDPKINPPIGTTVVLRDGTSVLIDPVSAAALRTFMNEKLRWHQQEGNQECV